MSSILRQYIQHHGERLSGIMEQEFADARSENVTRRQDGTRIMGASSHSGETLIGEGCTIEDVFVSESAHLILGKRCRLSSVSVTGGGVVEIDDDAVIVHARFDLEAGDHIRIGKRAIILYSCISGFENILIGDDCMMYCAELLTAYRITMTIGDRYTQASGKPMREHTTGPGCSVSVKFGCRSVVGRRGRRKKSKERLHVDMADDVNVNASMEIWAERVRFASGSNVQELYTDTRCVISAHEVLVGAGAYIVNATRVCSRGNSMLHATDNSLVLERGSMLLLTRTSCMDANGSGLRVLENGWDSR